jgi:hypothetical protein
MLFLVRMITLIVLVRTCSVYALGQTTVPRPAEGQASKVAPPGKKVPTVSDKELDVLEQAFRQLIAENAKDKRPLFLAPSKQRQALNVDDAFVRRFSDLKLDIRRRSQWKAGAGTLLKVQMLKWVSDTEVELNMTRYWGNVGAVGYSCHFHIEDGAWKLKKGTKSGGWIS